ncbi:hypothetical protein BGW80DRAFT_1332314 [Lactifluus volemus]|nr:hypothetical protein BGW80DRAFT_1332314 [Lactifluus volemus]
MTVRRRGCFVTVIRSLSTPFVAPFLRIVGACLKGPSFKEITWASEMKTRTIDDMDSRMGFANFVMRHLQCYGTADLASAA